MTALNRKSSDPPPPYSSGILNPIRPYLPAVTNAERSTIRSRSHFSALGTSSRSMYCLVVSRSCSCSASKTHRFISARLLCFPYRLPFLCERQRSLLGILRPEQRLDFLEHPSPLRFFVRDHAVVDAVGHPLAGLNRQRRVHRNAFCESQRRL